MAGRRPLPTRLKVIRGTLRPGRVRGDEPQPDGLMELPSPPSWLNRHGRKKWRELGPELIEMGLLTELDLPAFEALCAHYGAMVEAAHLLKDGVLIEGERGMVKHPAAQIHRDNSAAFARYCSMFGITPADRSRVGVKKKQPTKNPFLALG